MPYRLPHLTAAPGAHKPRNGLARRLTDVAAEQESPRDAGGSRPQAAPRQLPPVWPPRQAVLAVQHVAAHAPQAVGRTVCVGQTRAPLPPWHSLETVALTAQQTAEASCAITCMPLQELLAPVACFAGQAVHIFEWAALNTWTTLTPRPSADAQTFINPLNRCKTPITALKRVVATPALSPVRSGRGER